MPTHPTKPTWSPWRPFPNPRNRGLLTAPLGPGLYELRRCSTGRLILIGIGGNVADRMPSLLPENKGGASGRRNKLKRRYVSRYLSDIQYRTCATDSRDDALRIETQRRHKLDYIYPT